MNDGPVITRTDYRRILRNLPGAHAFTAINSSGPMLYSESWSDTTLDTTNIWLTAVGATGTVTQTATSGRNIALLDLPAAADTARLSGQQLFNNPIGYAAAVTTDIWQQVVFEWEMLLGTLANIDNAAFIAGLVTNPGDPARRDSNSVIGFVLASDALNTLTDADGTEAINVVSGAPTLTVSNHYAIVVRVGAVDFYVNHALVKTHSTAANLPLARVVPHFYCVAEAATGATKVEVGALRAYYKDTTDSPF